MATFDYALPPLEVQADFLFKEMGTGDGQNIAGYFQSNRNISAAEAAIQFENKFERSGGSNLSGREDFANQVYNAAQNGNLSSLSDNAQYMYNRAIQEGYTSAQAAGIVGNLMAESTTDVNPYIVNEIGASGIAQWLSSRKTNLLNYSNSDGKTIPKTSATSTDTIEPDEENEESNRPVNPDELERRRTGQAQSTPVYFENVLNSLESYTYKWKIYIVPPLSEGYTIQRFIDERRFFILSESGVENEISIDTVRQTLVLFDENRNGIANKFEIDFIEPGGLTFYNRIKFAADSLGIKNHLQANYILELTFPGWSDSGIPVANAAGPFRYMTILKSLNMSFRDGASFYQGIFIEVKENAYTKIELEVNTDITVVASTFGEFLTSFQDQYNEQLKRQVARSQNRVIPDDYEFLLDDDTKDWANFVFDSVEPGNLPQSSGVSVNGSSGQLNITIAPGTHIPTAIAVALFQTHEYRKIISSSRGSYGKDHPNDAELKPASMADLLTWLSFDTDVRYYETYDRIAELYPKKIRYIIKKYIVPEITHDPVSDKELHNNSELQKTRLSKLFETRLVRKKYDYYLTGLNTEVLNFDIDFNYLFYYIQSIHHGTLSYTRTGDDLQDELSKNAQRIRELEARKKQIQDTSNGLVRDSSINTVLRNIDRQIESINLESLQVQDRLKRNSRTRPPRSFTENYITQSQVIPTVDSNSITFLPSYRSGPIDSLATVGPDKEVSSTGAAQLGATETNLHTTGDLVQIVLTIRGDPYWLGRPEGFQENENQANYQIGGLSFYLKVNFPTYPSETTGLMEQLTSTYLVSGLYRVREVLATYQNGMFVMDLTSFKDLHLNVPEVFEYLERGYVGTENNNKTQAPRTKDAIAEQDRESSASDTSNAAQAGTNNRGHSRRSDGTFFVDENYTGTNGRLDTNSLTSIGGGHKLRADAASAYQNMVAAAASDGISWGVTDSYRSYESQVDLANRKGLYSEGGLAAYPGTSNHGVGRAVDLNLSSEASSWLQRNAGTYGFTTINREPWHWEYKG